MLKFEKSIMATESSNHSSSSDESSGDESNPTGGKKLFIGNLPADMTKIQLSNYFEKFGPVKYVHLVIDPLTQLNRGYGFVKFTDNTTLREVLAISEHVIDGNSIRTQKFHLKKKSQNKLLIEGICNFTTKFDLAAYFSVYGKIKKILLGGQDPELPGGTAHITFFKNGVVEQVLRQSTHHVDNRNVRCSKAQPIEELGRVSSTQLEEVVIAVTEPGDESRVIVHEPGDLPSTSKK